MPTSNRKFASGRGSSKPRRSLRTEESDTMHRSPNALEFFEARARFLEGSDTPSDYLARCIATIEARDRDVRAFVTLGLDNARRAAEESTRRYRAGKPLSSVDGMPIGVKDIMDTAD